MGLRILVFANILILFKNKDLRFVHTSVSAISGITAIR